MSWLTIHMNMECIYEMDFIYDDSSTDTYTSCKF